MCKIFKIFVILICFLTSIITKADEPAVTPISQSFLLNVICPLDITVAPDGELGPDAYEYIKPVSGGTDITYTPITPTAAHVFTVKGSTLHPFYYKIESSNNEPGTGSWNIVNFYTGGGISGLSQIVDRGVTLTMKWSMGSNLNLQETPPDGTLWSIGNYLWTLSGARNGKPPLCDGRYFITCNYRSVTVSADAELGVHTFSNNVYVSYCSF